MFPFIFLYFRTSVQNSTVRSIDFYLIAHHLVYQALLEVIPRPEGLVVTDFASTKQMLELRNLYWRNLRLLSVAQWQILSTSK